MVITLKKKVEIDKTGPDNFECKQKITGRKKE